MDIKLEACQKSVGSESGMKLHLNVHSTGQFQCIDLICDETYSQERDLERHMDVHTSDERLHHHSYWRTTCNFGKNRMTYEASRVLKDFVQGSLGQGKFFPNGMIRL